MKKILSILLITALCVSLTPSTVSAAVKISKAKATMEVDSTLKLKVNGTKSKISWKTSKKAVATVSSSGTVTAESEGQAIITATAGNKKYTCTINVVDSNKDDLDLTLSDITSYLKEKNLISGNETKMDASYIGGLSGIKYTDSKVEIYEYDINSDVYKTIIKTNKVLLSTFNIELTVSAINSRFILLCEDSPIKDTIIKEFNSIK